MRFAYTTSFQRRLLQEGVRIERAVSILGFCIDVRKKVGYVRQNTRKGVCVGACVCVCARVCVCVRA